jgi:hypothetical protein
MGAAYLFYGPISGSLTLSQASAVFTGVPWGGDVDEAVSGAGDVNGDGYTDLIIGDDQQGSYPPCGEAYVVFGPVSGLSSLEDAEVVLSGANQGDHAGYAVASAGDVDGDGLDDVLVGAYLHGEEDTKEEDRGMVHLLVSPVEGELSLGDAAASMVGETMFGQAGACLAGAGDLDDDGLADFLIGAPKEDAADTERLGRAYAVLGVPSGVVSLASAEIRILGAMENDRTGSSVAGSGDVDGDGALDIIIGAEYAYEGSSTVGGAFIILAPEPGSYDLADPDIRLVGSAGYAGAAVDGAGDMDGDGREEVLIGAPASDASANDAGTVYLVSIPITY